MRNRCYKFCSVAIISSDIFTPKAPASASIVEIVGWVLLHSSRDIVRIDKPDNSPSFSWLRFLLNRKSLTTLAKDSLEVNLIYAS